MPWDKPAVKDVINHVSDLPGVPPAAVGSSGWKYRGSNPERGARSTFESILFTGAGTIRLNDSARVTKVEPSMGNFFKRVSSRQIAA